MYQKILIGVDGTESNKSAVRTALKMAKESGAEVTAMCVYNIGYYPSSIWGLGEGKENMIKKAEQDLAFAINTAAEMGVKLETKVSIGRPSEAIRQEAANYDLVIVGTHGRKGISRVVLGSVAAKISKKAPCPVLNCSE